MNPSVRFCLALLLFSWLPVQADEAEISDFSWMDRNHMAQQVKKVDDLARQGVGSQIREDKSDLDTLQRIVDRDLVAQDNPLLMQAMGAVLGNVMAGEVKELEWKIYEDNRGRSRALCVEGTDDCLFPITMLSRRMEVGLKPDVHKIYRDALEMVEPLLPEMPYGGSSANRR